MAYSSLPCAEGGPGRPERRAYPRQVIKSLAYVELCEGNGGVILNISEGGMSVKSIMGLMSDDLPGVLIQLAHSKKDIELDGRVVWSTDLGTVVGVQFVDLTDEVRHLIREYILLEGQQSSKEPTRSSEKSRPTVTAQGAKRTENSVSATLDRRGSENQDQATASILPDAVPLTSEVSLVARSEELQTDSALPKKWQAVLVAVAAIILLAAGFFELQSKPSVAPRETTSTGRIDSHLGLKLVRAGSDWQISWNSNAPAVLKATKGQLFVTDGSLDKSVDLDPSDLHSGTIIYSPLTNDVVWKLQVTDGSSEPISESVRTVSSAPSMIVKSGVASSTAGLSVTPTEHLSYRVTSNSELERDLQKPHETKKSSEGDFIAGTKATGAAGPLRVISKTTAGPSESLTKSLTSNPSPYTRPSVPATATESVPVIAAKSVQTEALSRVPGTTRKGGLFQAAQMLVSINPSYPASARQDGISGTVELHFKIGLDGAVHDVSVVRGPSILAKAALEAVAERKYRPARVDGVPTETEASAIFDFKLE